MRDRVPLFVLLAGALTFLASLFLPWRETSAENYLLGTGSPGLVNLFAGGHIDGWIGLAGDVSVLLVVAVVLATVAALRRPGLAVRLPFTTLGVALGYFAIGVALEVNTLSRELGTGFTGLPKPQAPHTSWTYGFYLGLASAGVAALSGLAVPRGKPLRIPEAGDYLADVLGIALLVSFLLPWSGARGPATFDVDGLGAATAIAALALILGAPGLHGETARRWRLPVAVAIAVLTGGAAGAIAPGFGHRYGTWIGIGCAVSLVALEAVRALPLQLPVIPGGQAAVRIGAATLLLVALFLPWQQIHITEATQRGYAGWHSAAGAAAGALCLLLLASPASQMFESYVLDAVVAIVIFVSVAGTAFRLEFVYRIGYGAFVGFAAAAALLVVTLAPLRSGHVNRRRALARAVPLAACVLCIAAIVLPSWFVLPQSWTSQAYALYGSLTVPGVLLSLYLAHLWARRVRGPVSSGNQLVLVPLTILSLASLELIRFRNGEEVVWGAVILVGLCLLLILLGWIEERSGLENFRVPGEFWRIDRLPGAEG